MFFFSLEIVTLRIEKNLHVKAKINFSSLMCLKHETIYNFNYVVHIKLKSSRTFELTHIVWQIQLR